MGEELVPLAVRRGRERLQQPWVLERLGRGRPLVGVRFRVGIRLGLPLTLTLALALALTRTLT